MFNKNRDKEIVVPVKLELNNPFCFSCDKDLACFTKCCKDSSVTLTPYDIIRMKNRLNMSSQEFLSFYTAPAVIEGTELPIPMLKPLKENTNECPFIAEDGCVIFDHRPLNCRYYPLGFGIYHNKDQADNEKFFALIKEPICAGHGLGGEITVKEWLESQGIPEYETINSPWVEIILKRKSLGPFVTIPEKTLQMFFLACYNVDGFRDFVFDTKFISVFELSDERIQKVKEDDLECLKLAIDWLKTVLLGERVLKTRENKAEIF